MEKDKQMPQISQLRLNYLDKYKRLMTAGLFVSNNQLHYCQPLPPCSTHLPALCAAAQTHMTHLKRLSHSLCVIHTHTHTHNLCSLV